MNLLSNPQAPQRGGTRAWLISPLFSATGRTRCLSFYYFMYERSIDPAGPSLGSLRVHVKSASGEAGGKITTLWRLHNHQGQRWQTSRTPVVMGDERAAPSSPYQVNEYNFQNIPLLYMLIIHIVTQSEIGHVQKLHF